MRADGNTVGLDHSFTLDPDNDGHVVLESPLGNRAFGVGGFEGTTVEVRVEVNDGAVTVPLGSYGLASDIDVDDAEIWRALGLDADLDAVRYWWTLADILDGLEDDPAGFLRSARRLTA